MKSNNMHINFASIDRGILSSLYKIIPFDAQLQLDPKLKKIAAFHFGFHHN